MVEFVVKMEGKWWRNGWPKEGEGGSLAAGRLHPVGWKEKERKMKEREEDRGVFIRREKYYNNVANPII